MNELTNVRWARVRLPRLYSTKGMLGSTRKSTGVKKIVRGYLSSPMPLRLLHHVLSQVVPRVWRNLNAWPPNNAISCVVVGRHTSACSIPEHSGPLTRGVESPSSLFSSVSSCKLSLVSYAKWPMVVRATQRKSESHFVTFSLWTCCMGPSGTFIIVAENYICLRFSELLHSVSTECSPQIITSICLAVCLSLKVHISLFSMCLCKSI